MIYNIPANSFSCCLTGISCFLLSFFFVSFLFDKAIQIEYNALIYRLVYNIKKEILQSQFVQ